MRLATCQKEVGACLDSLLYSLLSFAHRVQLVV